MKRSQAISLVLLAGVGATAFALARVDPSQDEEDALIYRTEQDCVDAKARPEGECREEYQSALRSYRAGAPRYGDLRTCEAHHGPRHCRPTEEIGPGGPAGGYGPFMAAYMIGKTAAQGMPAQPLYDHEPEGQQGSGSASHGGGGYCTSSGARVQPAYSRGVASVPRSATRPVTTTPRVVARGGFGFTGRSIASHGSGGGHGTSGS